MTGTGDQSGSFREDAPRPPVPGEEGQTPPTRSNPDGLGEPAGSAPPDSPPDRWSRSLQSLLGDQDGAHLFRTFLEREKCEDTLDFWFACNGFRQMDLKDPKTLRVAKAIHKRYLENSSVVSEQLRPPTKDLIRDGIRRQQIHSAMFDRAQAEIQSLMEDRAYDMFLTSDIYLGYIATGGDNATGGPKLLSCLLPPLTEEEELNCAKGSPCVPGLSSRSLRATASARANGSYRSYRQSDPINPYHVGGGYVFAPATSANESDAMTDDSMSMTDSSVDGINPSRPSHKKQQQREIHRNVRANGQVALPHFPRTQRPPREMTPVEPARFAAELIVRLEKVRQEQETLQLITEEEEREECETPHDPQPLGSCEDDPQTILDEHLSRVLKTPGCQSPAAVGRSGVQTSRHVHHHHYIHQHQAVTAEPRRLVCPCCYVRTQRRGADPPLLHMDAAGGRCARREADAIVYLEERTSKHRSHSAQNIRRNPTRDSTRAVSAERPGRHHQCSAPTGRSRQPPHPLLQDTAVVSVSTLAQLEEACRRLAEVSRPKLRQKEPKRQQSAPWAPELTLTYFFCGEEIPYRRALQAQSLTLRHFKEQLSKKGDYRYYFKTSSQEFECGAVFEEICDDDAILPLYEGRVLGKVERIE